MDLKSYITLGRSGLRVSPLVPRRDDLRNRVGLGRRGSRSRCIFDGYVDAGGDFVDTANGYQKVSAKRWAESSSRIEAARAHRARDEVHLQRWPGNPNAGGNGGIDVCLARRVAPPPPYRLRRPLLDARLGHGDAGRRSDVDADRSGASRENPGHGLSDTPAWYVARAHTLAEEHGKEARHGDAARISLVERNIEREHIPAAKELGIGICPGARSAAACSPASTSGKATAASGDGRLTKGGSPFNKFTENNWRILEILLGASEELGKPAAQVAIQWAVTQPGITSTILGASSLAQLNDNLASLEFTIPDAIRKRLDDATALEQVHPYVFFGGMIQGMIHGGVEVKAWKAAAGH